MLTLHDLRWTYVAGRAAVFLTLLFALSLTNASRGVYVHAPSLRSGSLYPARNDDLVVFVTRRAAVFAGSNWVRPGQLAEELIWLRKHNPRSRLVLRADRNVPFAEVRTVLRAARDAGYRRITVDGQAPVTLLERRILARFTLAKPDRSMLIERSHPDTSFRIDSLWH